MDARRKRILIVDDEEALTRLVQARLASVGFDVRTAASGQEALSCAADQQFDVVILDINLPDVDGYQVAKELRKLYHPWALPIIMLTVRDKPIDQLRGFAHGADAYLVKPFSSTELVETVALLTGEGAVSSRGEPL